MRKPSFIFLINLLLSISIVHGSLNIQRSKRSNSCLPGCATCSPLNGCLSCKPRFFFHLELEGIRQRGVCLTSCPRGHYGMRSPHVSVCIKCKPDCASCFSEHFCTRCHSGRFLFQGKCGNSCPHGLTANTELRECAECPAGCELCVNRNVCERCRADMYHLHGHCHHTCPGGFMPDLQLMQCSPPTLCEVGEWTSWSQCALKGGTRFFRRGEETRTRRVPHFLSVHANPCPHVSEVRKCVTKKKSKL